MPQKLLVLFFAFGLSLFSSLAAADDIADLKAAMEAMEARHQKEMLLLQKKIELLMQGRSETGGETALLTPPKSDLEDRVSGLEEDIEFVLESQESEAKDKDGTVLSMYATLEFDNFQQSKPNFDARNIEMFVTSSVTDRLNLTAEIEFERTAKTSGGNRAGEVEVEQGWMEYAINEQFNVRAGVILVPFGLYNLEHFDFKNELTDRPLTARRIVPTTWGEAGAGFSGSTTVSGVLAEYQFYMFNGLTNIISDKGLRDARGAFGEDNNSNKAMAARVAISPNQNATFGFSGYQGDYDQNGNNITGWNLDAQIQIKDLKLTGEYVNFDIDSGLNAAGVSVPEYMKGFYGQASYRFWPSGLNDSFLGKGFGSPTFAAVARYGQIRIADDGDFGFGENRETRLSIGLNYRPVETFAFKIEYQFNSGRNERLERGSSNGFLSSIAATF